MPTTELSLIIQDHHLGGDHPTDFIADIAANHDGDLERAKALIHLAAEAAPMRRSFSTSRLRRS